MLAGIWIILCLGLVVGSVGNNRQRFLCKFRDNNFIPTCVIRFIYLCSCSELFDRLQQEEVRDAIRKIFAIITWFFILLSGINTKSDLTEILLLLQIIYIYKLIAVKILNKIRKIFCVIIFLCIVGMLIASWANLVILTTDFVIGNNIEGAIRCVNCGMLLTIGAFYYFYYKWNSVFGVIGKKFLWSVLFLLNAILVLFAFGTLNLVYSSWPNDIEALMEIINNDSKLLFFGRMVYSGAIPAFYGKDAFKATVSQDNINLATVYDMGKSFSYGDLIFFNEVIFMAGTLYVGHAVRPLVKSRNYS